MPKDKKPEEKFYATATKEAAKLDAKNGQKANVLQKAYEAAVSELGYSDKQLMESGKAKNVAKLMFSDKYLGSAEFNPLLKDKEFGEKSEIQKQQSYENMLGMNLDSFVRTGGVVDRYGGLRRGSVAEAVDRHLQSQSSQQVSALLWQQNYDPNKSLADNMESYANVLRQDPILAHTGAKLDSGKFESIDDAAQAVATSVMGKSSREGYQYRHGVDFS